MLALRKIKNQNIYIYIKKLLKNNGGRLCWFLKKIKQKTNVKRIK